ncbi:hypothetical protein EMIHUDRAFT_201398 [Emiliania huxleyi CCMP1516]|uniref:Methyltransferase domain-containing protein n=2 Tax=Emiliania huxleyi TaxID=2903 RepID=A0A0D3KHX2_EMIH1|nr:hypothetical protein EMIHUDRAFT_201398 [Emiliania huxleyi CCMP1516]EOD35357.1 hypothetical protein EMIHUDRAFT_201398 [Emiliania huxleyi CCMP1516]|eukprot:XP_005787786.1 hypothetical protein EMIHUDRAFT_201398 [Emiliania huxleyi CCMP1516]
MRSCLLLALAAPAAGFSALAALASRPLAIGAAATALVATIFAWVLRVFNTPSRSYRDGEREAGGINSVGEEYDAWTSEGILEYYWGEHIHLGYYEEGQRKAPLYGGKDFVEAKVLDVGCGIGGTSRYIAKKFPSADVTGITISPEQRNDACFILICVL